MPKVFDPKSGATFDVAPEEVRRVLTERPDLQLLGQVDFGEEGVQDADNARVILDHDTLDPEGSDVNFGELQQGRRDEYYDDQNLETAIEGVGRGLTFGLNDVLAELRGDEQELEDRAQRRIANPVVSTLSEVGGALTGALATGGTSGLARGLAYTPAGLSARLATSTGNALVRGRGLGSAVLRGSVIGAVENATFGLGQQVTGAVLHDDPFTVDAIASQLTTDAVLGAGFGGVTGLVGHGLSKVLRKTADEPAKALAHIEKTTQNLDQVAKAEFTEELATRAASSGSVVDDAVKFNVEAAEQELKRLRGQLEGAEASFQRGGVARTKQSGQHADRIAKAEAKLEAAKDVVAKRNVDVAELERQIKNPKSKARAATKEKRVIELNRRKKLVKAAKADVAKAEKALTALNEQAPLLEQQLAGQSVAPKRLETLRRQVADLEQQIAGFRSGRPNAANEVQLAEGITQGKVGTRGNLREFPNLRDKLFAGIESKGGSVVRSRASSAPRSGTSYAAAAKVQKSYRVAKATLEGTLKGYTPGAGSIRKVARAHDRFMKAARELDDLAGGVADDALGLDAIRKQLGDSMPDDFLSRLDELNAEETFAYYGMKADGVDPATQLLVKAHRAAEFVKGAEGRVFGNLTKNMAVGMAQGAVPAGVRGTTMQERIVRGGLRAMVGWGVNKMVGVPLMMGKGAATRVAKAVKALTSNTGRKTANLTTNSILSRYKFGESKSKDPAVARIEELEKWREKAAELEERVGLATAEITAAHPQLGAKVQTALHNKFQYLLGQLPERYRLDRLTLAKALREPTKYEMAKFARIVRAVEDPLTLLDDLERGDVAPEAVEAVKATAPAVFSRIQEELMVAVASLPEDQGLPYQTRLQLSVLFDAPIDSTQAPGFTMAMEEMFASQAQAQPQPRGSLGVPSTEDEMTAAQRLTAK